MGTGLRHPAHTDNNLDRVWSLTGSARLPRRAIHRHYRPMPMPMPKSRFTVRGMDGIIQWTEARGVRGAVVQSHLYIRRCLCGPWGYLRNRRRRLALEGVGTSERGRGVGRGRGIRFGIGNESVGGSESEGEVALEVELESESEDLPQEAGMGMPMEETRATVVGSVGVCRIHRVRATPISLFTLALRCVRPNVCLKGLIDIKHASSLLSRIVHAYIYQLESIDGSFSVGLSFRTVHRM